MADNSRNSWDDGERPIEVNGTKADPMDADRRLAVATSRGNDLFSSTTGATDASDQGRIGSMSNDVDEGEQFAPLPRTATEDELATADEDAWSWAPRDDEVPLGDLESGDDHRALTGTPSRRAPRRAPRKQNQGIAAVTNQVRSWKESLTSRIAASRQARVQRASSPEDVEIVSGQGAPERFGRHRAAMEQTAIATPPTVEGETGEMPAVSGSSPLEAFDEADDQALHAEPTIPTTPVVRDALRPSREGRHVRGVGRISVRSSGIGETLDSLRERFMGNPDRGWIAGGAVAMAIILIAMLGTALNTPKTTLAQQLQSQAPVPAASFAISAAPVPSTPPSVAPTAAAVAGQTIGNGGTGWKIDDFRYGIHGNVFRFVADMSAAGSPASGQPTATVSHPDQNTVVVTFTGVAAPTSVPGLPNATLVTSITQVTSGLKSGQVAFKMTLARPLTPSATYLASPLRFVLDLH